MIHIEKITKDDSSILWHTGFSLKKISAGTFGKALHNGIYTATFDLMYQWKIELQRDYISLPVVLTNIFDTSSTDFKY